MQKFDLVTIAYHNEKNEFMCIYSNDIWASSQEEAMRIAKDRISQGEYREYEITTCMSKYNFENVLGGVEGLKILTKNFYDECDKAGL